MGRAESDRTYGNWRRPASPGVAGLGLAGTLILMVGLVVVVITMMISLPAALVAAGVVATILTPLLIRDRHGRNGLQALTARLAWLRGKRAGHNLYRSGPLGYTSTGAFQLPGLAAPTEVLEAQDSYGRPFAMVVVPATGHYTVVLEACADGAALVDADQVDTWVAHWGQWLAALAYEPGLAAASVTIETAPDLGTRVEQEVSANLSEHAPSLARQVLTEVVRTYPAGSAQVSTRIALTYSAASRPGARRRGQEEMIREIATRLPGLSAGLSMTGAGAARPMTSRQLAHAVRVAYDPAAHHLLADLDATGQPDGDPAETATAWGQVGPAGAQESWDHYRHDSGTSITWSMSEAPRGEVYAGVLTDLLAPHRDILRKRVSLLYRPHDPASAARIVERDRKDARFRIGSANAAARDSVALAAADQTAREEATGAGLVRFGLLMTATVAHPDDLAAAAAAADVLAPPARIALRRMYGAQAAAFAANLPLGLVLTEHLAVPQFIREAM